MNQLSYGISMGIFQEYQITVQIGYQHIPGRSRGSFGQLQIIMRSTQDILFHLEVSIKTYSKLPKRGGKKTRPLT